MDLDIAGAGALQPIEDWREARLVGVPGMDLPLVFERRRQRQRLAATAGAIIEDLFAGLREDEIGDDLAALVLDLEPALLESRLGLDVGHARRALSRRDTQALAGDDGRFRTGLGKLFEHLVAIRLQRVDAKIQRSALRQRGGLGDPLVIEILLEIIGAPVGDVGLDMRLCEGEVALCGGFQYFSGDFGRELVVGESLAHLVERDVPLPPQRTEGERGGAGVIHQVGGGKLLAQGVVDEIADRRAVARAGKAMRQAPVLQRVGGRPPSRLDILQHFDGCADPSAKAHVVHIPVFFASLAVM